jgi:hypothetical protein
MNSLQFALAGQLYYWLHQNVCVLCVHETNETSTHTFFRTASNKLILIHERSSTSY